MINQGKESKYQAWKGTISNNHANNPDSALSLGCPKEFIERYKLETNPEYAEKAFLIQNYLKNPEILNLIDAELDKKIVGENENRKVIFLVANMRNVENLSKGSDNLIVNALSGTGKDHVVGAVFDLIPDSEKEELLRTTPKVLAYTRNRKAFGGKKDE